MRRTTISRRRFVIGTTVTAATLAGCTGSETTDGDRSDDSSGDASDGGSTDTPSTTMETVAGEGDPTAGNSPDPDCDRLTGDPVPYDASDTLFVFSFDYIDSWELAAPLAGPRGRTQGITSPIVTVDGERESAGIQIVQSAEALSANSSSTGKQFGSSDSRTPTRRFSRCGSRTGPPTSASTTR